jgi:hypothetical protein
VYVFSHHYLHYLVDSSGYADVNTEIDNLKNAVVKVFLPGSMSPLLASHFIHAVDDQVRPPSFFRL